MVSRSGKQAVETTFLEQTVVQTSQQRIGAGAVSRVYNLTVFHAAPKPRRHHRVFRSDTPQEMTATMLNQVTNLMTVLKLRQGAIVLFFNPDGAVPPVPRPRHLVLVDRTTMFNEMRMCNHRWDGLDDAVIEVNKVRWTKYPSSLRWVHSHQCDRCTKEVPLPSGTLVTMRPVVIDGIEIGHACCGVSGCKIPLKRVNLDRFCPRHEGLHHICASLGQGADNCILPARPNHKTCAIHAWKEEELAARMSQGSHHARRREVQQLGQNRNVPPNAFMGNAVLAEEQRLPAGSHQLQRSFTHCNFTGVLSCGIFCMRSTFHDHEGETNVMKALSKNWPNPADRPKIILYDRACFITRHIRAQNIVGWEGTHWYVDRFHFPCHSINDVGCQQYNNPELRHVPWLWNAARSEFLWNSPAAEGGNSWMQCYSHIVRPMTSHQHDMTLDNNSLAKNEVHELTLRRSGH